MTLAGLSARPQRRPPKKIIRSGLGKLLRAGDRKGRRGENSDGRRGRGNLRVGMLRKPFVQRAREKLMPSVNGTSPSGICSLFRVQ